MITKEQIFKIQTGDRVKATFSDGTVVDCPSVNVYQSGAVLLGPRGVSHMPLIAGNGGNPHSNVESIEHTPKPKTVTVTLPEVKFDQATTHASVHGNPVQTYASAKYFSPSVIVDLNGFPFRRMSPAIARLLAADLLAHADLAEGVS